MNNKFVKVGLAGLLAASLLLAQIRLLSRPHPQHRKQGTLVSMR